MLFHRQDARRLVEERGIAVDGAIHGEGVKEAARLDDIHLRTCQREEFPHVEPLFPRPALGTMVRREGIPLSGRYEGECHPDGQPLSRLLRGWHRLLRSLVPLRDGGRPGDEKAYPRHRSATGYR